MANHLSRLDDKKSSHNVHMTMSVFAKASPLPHTLPPSLSPGPSKRWLLPQGQAVCIGFEKKTLEADRLATKKGLDTSSKTPSLLATKLITRSFQTLATAVRTSCVLQIRERTIRIRSAGNEERLNTSSKAPSLLATKLVTKSFRTFATAARMSSVNRI